MSGPATSKNQIGGNMSGESMVNLLDVTSQQPGLELPQNHSNLLWMSPNEVPLHDAPMRPQMAIDQFL